MKRGKRVREKRREGEKEGMKRGKEVREKKEGRKWKKKE